MRLQIVMAALTGALETDMKRAQNIVARRSREMEKQAYETGRKIGAGLRDSIVGALGGIALGAAFRNAVQQADQLGEIAERAGMGAEELSRLGYAAKMSGIELQQFADANRGLASRLEKNEELLAKLGVDTFDEVAGKSRTTADIIRQLGDAFAGMPDGVEKTNVAIKLFGERVGVQMIPLLNRGTDGIVAMEREADILGQTISDETAAQAGEFNDQLDRMGGIMRNLLLQALPALNAALAAGAKAFLVFQGAVQKAGMTMAAAVMLLDKYAGAIADQFKRVTEMAGFYSDVMEVGFGPALDKWKANLTAFFNEPAKQGINTVMEYVRLLGEMGQVDQRTAQAIAAIDGSVGGPSRTQVLPDLSEDPEEKGGGRGARATRIRQTKEEAEAERALAAAKKAVADRIAAADEARRQAKAAREEELAWGQQMVNDLKFELELMKMTNAEAQTAIQLRGMSAEAVARYGDEILALNQQLEQNMKLTEQMDGLRQATSNLFEDLISGTVSAKDAFRSFVDDILANITRMIANNFAQSLFGGMGQTGGGLFGGFAQSLFGGLFGGLAGGGPVSGGTPYIVGENGPELFIPQTAGRIANNAEVRGMGRGGTTINISVEGQVDMRSRQQLAADVGRASQKSIARTY